MPEIKKNSRRRYSNFYRRKKAYFISWQYYYSRLLQLKIAFLLKWHFHYSKFNVTPIMIEKNNNEWQFGAFPMRASPSVTSLHAPVDRAVLPAIIHLVVPLKRVITTKTWVIEAVLLGLIINLTRSQLSDCIVQVLSTYCIYPALPFPSNKTQERI